MEKFLVIVESPSKAKTINRYLGDNYLVKSCFGHIRDLPTNSTKIKLKKQVNTKFNNSLFGFEKENLINKIGIDPYKNWKVKYHILPEKKKILAELKNISKLVKNIYLATDLDREGEAIAWHLKESIGDEKSKFIRIVFNEITKSAILKALKNPCQINMNKVYAQQARRFMDRIVGYMLSPLLWKKVSRGLSAGRVQSVAVRIIVEREKLIKSFQPKKYFQIYLTLQNADNQFFSIKVTHYKKKILTINNYEEAQNFSKLITSNSDFYVIDKIKKIIETKPLAPFITSTLQQSAYIYLGFGVNKTMKLAQQLYELGYITYIRTDSIRVSDQALEQAASYIKKYYGESYLPNYYHEYKQIKTSQEAHEAIRPTNISISINNLSKIESNGKKLYQLIFSQFIASQMTSSKYQIKTIFVKANNLFLKKRFKTLIFDGWTKIFSNYLKKNEKIIIPKFFIGKKLNLKCVEIKTSLSKPPCRFNEASLVKELEKKGIGRPSTYAVIISTIQNRGYAFIKNKKFYAKKMGEIVTKRLIASFGDLMNYDFTADMEFKFDQISNNQTCWKKVLNGFFSDFYKKFKKSVKLPDEGGMTPNNLIKTVINCIQCNKKMIIKTAINGVFLSCIDYFSKSIKKCKNTISLIEEELLDQKESKILFKLCEKCQMYMNAYFINLNSKLYICSNNPDCTGYLLEKEISVSNRYDDVWTKCQDCGGEMNFKIGKFGIFLLCSMRNCNYTKNMFNLLLPRNFPKISPISLPELTCKYSNSWFVLKSGVSGIFLASNLFPKSKETRAPLIEELLQFQKLLPREILYLTTAPTVDNEGNKTILRFNKEKGIQYVGSKKNGRFTSNNFFFIEGKWKLNK